MAGAFSMRPAFRDLLHAPLPHHVVCGNSASLPAFARIHPSPLQLRPSPDPSPLRPLLLQGRASGHRIYRTLWQPQNSHGRIQDISIWKACSLHPPHRHPHHLHLPHLPCPLLRLLWCPQPWNLGFLLLLLPLSPLLLEVGLFGAPFPAVREPQGRSRPQLLRRSQKQRPICWGLRQLRQSRQSRQLRPLLSGQFQLSCMCACEEPQNRTRAWTSKCPAQPLLLGGHAWILPLRLQCPSALVP
mmetsp:Transcript_69687/g.110016  ORF Transcript_69687/g.110016 Transcript_69687/m.110016 type:complete len:243 (-) Transcript_69687:35-763(-)